jgi:hypothetical protein
MQLIATATVGATNPTFIDLASIPQTFTDLCLVFSLRTTINLQYQDVNVFFNDNGSGYSSRRLFVGAGGTVSSTTGTGTVAADGATSTSNTFSNGTLYIPNYTSANNKNYSIDVVTETNATVAFSEIVSAIWANTAAITKIALVSDTPTFLQGSTISLYGILKGSSGGVVVS